MTETNLGKYELHFLNVTLLYLQANIGWNEVINLQFCSRLFVCNLLTVMPVSFLYFTRILSSVCFLNV